jgi:hypothetical protein
VDGSPSLSVGAIAGIVVAVVVVVILVVVLVWYFTVGRPGPESLAAVVASESSVLASVEAPPAIVPVPVSTAFGGVLRKYHNRASALRAAMQAAH